MSERKEAIDSQIGRSALSGGVRITRIAKQPLAPTHFSRHVLGGMIYREIRVGASAIIALAILMGLAALLVVMREYLQSAFGSTYGLPSPELLPDIWRIGILIVFFLMGIICGAEEAENGTENFALRLPVSRLQIYLEKTAGSLLCIAIWFALSLVLVIGICSIGSISGLQMHEVIAMGDLGAVLASGVFLYFCGQAAGAWTGRVILGSVIGGSIGIAVLGSIQFMDNQIIQMAISRTAEIIIAIATIIACAAAITRFLTREGR